MAFFGGFFNPVQYQKEQERVRNLLSTEGTLPGKEHLLEFLEAWEMSSNPDQKEKLMTCLINLNYSKTQFETLLFSWSHFFRIFGSRKLILI